MRSSIGDPGYIRRRIEPLFAVNKIVTIHYFEFSDGFRGPSESHDFWEFVYVDKGSVLHFLEKEEMVLTQGDFLFIAPNRPHQLYSHAGTNPNVFIITFVCHSRAMASFRNRRDRLPQQLKHCIADIIAEARQTYDLAFDNPGMLELLSKSGALPGGQQMIQLILQQLLIHLYRALQCSEDSPAVLPDADASTGNALADRMLAYIRQNVYAPLSSGMVCEHIGYSGCYLSTLFHKHCGVSISETINRVKIDEARYLIRSGAGNFSEIAAMLHYSDLHYFSRVFRKITGMSPSEYRKSIQI